MTGSLPSYIYYIAAIIVSAIISMYAVKKIIFITRTRKLYDIPDNIRKIHGAQIASLGGIGIFIGYMTVATLFLYEDWFYIVGSSVILFFTGVYDDIMNMRPSKKLLAQILASAATVYFADIRITTLPGIEHLPYWLSIGLTTFLCTFFINVFNFVDGIDGLACIMAMLYTGVLGVLFAGMHDKAVAGIAFALAGATMGLLYYNIAPARIYMGDTGSMLLGFTIFILSVLFLRAYTAHGPYTVAPVHSANGAFIVVVSLLFLPVYDALRVFILRMSRGISPLRADRTHLHYYLLDAGLNHSQSVVVIVASNMLILALGYLMQDANVYITLAAITLLTSVLMAVVYMFRQRRAVKANL